MMVKAMRYYKRCFVMNDWVECFRTERANIAKLLKSAIVILTNSLTQICHDCILLSSPLNCINPLAAKLLNLNFHPLEIVSR